jgi:hypothetical protein
MVGDSGLWLRGLGCLLNKPKAQGIGSTVEGFRTLAEQAKGSGYRVKMGSTL